MPETNKIAVEFPADMRYSPWTGDELPGSPLCDDGTRFEAWQHGVLQQAFHRVAAKPLPVRKPVAKAAKPLRIAITGNVFPFGPDKQYGGERIVGYLCRGLTELGHEVVLFDRPQTAVDAADVAEFVPVREATEGGEGCDPFVPAVARYEAGVGKKFDVFHCVYFGSRWDREALTRWNYCELVWCDWCHQHAQAGMRPWNTVAYSRALAEDMQRSGRPATVIHYGIPFDQYAADPDHDGYLCWVGKIEAGKGVEWAMDVAERAGKTLVIMGPPYNGGYFREQILPRMRKGKVVWLRGVNDAVKAQVFRRAQAFLSANVDGWREHFGIVNIEALASGCPIVAWSRESVPSAVETDGVVRSGVNGEILRYRSSSADWMDVVARGAALVEKVGSYDRLRIRAEAEQPWGHLTMARRWEWFYEQIQDRRRHAPLTLPF